MTTKSATEMVNEAKAQIENLSPDEVEHELKAGNVTLLDIRESEELREEGKIEGAIYAPRGMLEFYADDTLPYHRPEFNKDNRLILYCAGGLRSALAAVTLKEMGYAKAAHLEGGFSAWKEEGKLVVG